MPYGPLLTRQYGPNPKGSKLTIQNMDDNLLYLSESIAAGGGGSNIGKLIGGGIVVGEWNESGVNKALVTSLTNLSVGLTWTEGALIGTLIGPTAQSYSDGLTNTNAIIAQTGSAPTTAYAAGLAKLYLGGGYNDWYLPSQWELNMCYQSAGIVTKVLGTANGFSASNYWCSTEFFTTDSFTLDFQQSFFYPTAKSFSNNVRAVRIHTL